MGEADIENAVQGVPSPMSAIAPAQKGTAASATPPTRADIDWQAPLEGTPPSRKDLFVDGAELRFVRDLPDDLQAITLRAGGQDWTFRARITEGRHTPPGPAWFLWASIHEVRLAERQTKEQD